VLLNPLPFHHPDELVALHENKPNFHGGSISYPNFRDWQKENQTFSVMAIARPYAFILTGSGEAEQVSGEFISSDFFRILGVEPLLGRTFAPGEDEIGGTPVALISQGFWARKLGSDPNVLHRTLTLDGKTYTIVGVVPSNFHLRIPSFRDVPLYVPIGQWDNNLLTSRGAGLGIHGIGRLKPGMSLEQAQADLDSVSRNLAAAYPDSDKGISAEIVPLKSQMVGRVRPALTILLFAVAFVLLIACVNIANLLLARSSVRSREFAIRVALGASQQRVFRQLLTESVLLAAIGGALGVLFAHWVTRAALGFLPAALPRAEEVTIDGRVLFFTFGVSVLAGVLFGLVPALSAVKPHVHEKLKQEARGVSSSHRAQSIFVITEMALAVVLLIGAGLMIRTLAHLWKVDPGFNPKNVLNFGVSLPNSVTKMNPDTIRASLRELESRLGTVPGVKAASQSLGAVPMGGDDEQLFWMAGQPKPASQNEMNWAIDYIVGPQYLDVMGIPLQRGRFLSEQDGAHSTAVIVVDDVFAHRYFPNQDPIRQRIQLNDGDRQVEIVGVVGHVKQWGLDSDDTQSLRAQIYIPWMQMPDAFIATGSSTALMLRTDGSVPTSAVLDSIRRDGHAMNIEAVFGAETMESIISATMAQRRFSMILLGAFATLAAMLAGIGIYGVISYLVARRTQEIGIRMALGANRADVMRLVLREGGRLAGAGIVLGAVGALFLTRFLANMLYGVSATDPITFAAIAALTLLLAMAACCFPAVRAMKIEPVVALRYE
jgi:predicted permease